MSEFGMDGQFMIPNEIAEAVAKPDAATAQQQVVEKSGLAPFLKAQMEDDK